MRQLPALLFSLLGIGLSGGCTLRSDEDTVQVNTDQTTLLHEVTIDVSPDGRYLLFTGQGRGVADIFRLNLFTGKVDQLTDTDEEEIHPRFSSDGKSIVFSRAKPGFRSDGYLNERHLYMMELQTKQVRQLTRASDRYDYWPALSSDGRFITFDGAVPETGVKIFIVAMFTLPKLLLDTHLV